MSWLMPKSFAMARKATTPADSPLTKLLSELLNRILNLVPAQYFKENGIPTPKNFHERLFKDEGAVKPLRACKLLFTSAMSEAFIATPF